MTCRRRVARALALALLVCAAPAAAQSPDELAAARELFQEAYRDEQELRYAEALEKFQRVAKVKESASVRYRIATVLAALGRLREARDVYRAIAAAKSTLPPADRATANSAAEKVVELDRRIPRLVLRLEDDAPPGVRVTLDGAPVPVSSTPRSIELDPGEHVVAATAGGAAPSEHRITLVEGAGEVKHTVTLAPADERQLMAEVIAPAAAPSTTTLPPPVVAPRRSNAALWAAVGGGAALAAAGGVLLVLREGTIGDIEAACPGDVCPASRRDAVEADRDRAALLGPLGGALAGAGLAAAGVGAYLLVRRASAAPEAAAILPGPGGVRVRLTF